MKSRKKKRVGRAVEVELGFIEGVAQRCPNDPKILKALGDLYTRCSRNDDGLRIDLKLSRLCPDESEVWYNLGCSYALVERKDDAFNALNRAVELGYNDYAWILRDDDLESIKSDPRFQLLVDRVVS